MVHSMFKTISQPNLKMGHITPLPKNYCPVWRKMHYITLWKQQRLLFCKGWSGGAMVLGKLPIPGRPTIWITEGQGPSALAVGAGGGCLDIFALIYPFFLFLPLFGRRPDID